MSESETPVEAASAEAPPAKPPLDRAVKIAIAKLVAVVLLDVADFTIGRIIGFGTMMDVVLAGVGFALFGWKGLLQLWEIDDPSEQIDGFVPTLTLIAIANLRQAQKGRIP